MTTETQFILKFDGVALERHEMDVVDFARSLMGLSDLFEFTKRKRRRNIKGKIKNMSNLSAVLKINAYHLARMT